MLDVSGERGEDAALGPKLEKGSTMQSRSRLGDLSVVVTMSVLSLHCAAEVATPADVAGAVSAARLEDNWSPTTLDIKAIDIGNDGDDQVYTWTSDNRCHRGSSTNLDESSWQVGGPEYSSNYLRGVGISKDTQDVYYYFVYGEGVDAEIRFTIGQTDCHDCFTGERIVSVPAGVEADWLRDVAISGNTGQVYFYWFDEENDEWWNTRGTSEHPDEYAGRVRAFPTNNSLVGIAFNEDDTPYAWYTYNNIVRTGIDSLRF